MFLLLIFFYFFVCFLPSIVTKSVREGKRIDTEIEKTESDLNEILGRLARLRRQRASLKDRSSDLLRRGMRELDVEDGVRSQEQAILDEQQTVADAQLTGAFRIVDWSAMMSDADLFGDLLVDGTGVSGVGSSSGV